MEEKMNENNNDNNNNNYYNLINDEDAGSYQ